MLYKHNMSTDDDLGLVFKALANSVRRRICDELKLRPLTTSQLCLGFPELDRCTVMQHLNILERAGLVVPVKKGRERFNYLDAMPIQALHARTEARYSGGIPRPVLPPE